jgi:hypothetical protein
VEDELRCILSATLGKERNPEVNLAEAIRRRFGTLTAPPVNKLRVVSAHAISGHSPNGRR